MFQVLGNPSGDGEEPARVSEPRLQDVCIRTYVYIHVLYTHMYIEYISDIMYYVRVRDLRGCCSAGQMRSSSSSTSW